MEMARETKERLAMHHLDKVHKGESDSVRILLRPSAGHRSKATEVEGPCGSQVKEV
jgi:hypothetical protein